MASEEQRAGIPKGLTGTGLTLGVVSARWNETIVGRLRDGADRAVKALGVTRVEYADVPGSYELPVAAAILARSGRVDAIVCLGAVIRGETTHYEVVAGECARGLQQVQLETLVPVLFGVLTVENTGQALARSEDAGGHNVGEQAVYGAVEMARLRQAWLPFSEPSAATSAS